MRGANATVRALIFRVGLTQERRSQSNLEKANRANTAF